MLCMVSSLELLKSDSFKLEVLLLWIFRARYPGYSGSPKTHLQRAPKSPRPQHAKATMGANG